jgi:hypothetical protein
MDDIWKQLASSWRTFILDKEADISIEILTEVIIDEIQKGELITNAFDYLDENENNDDDDDWP